MLYVYLYACIGMYVCMYAYLLYAKVFTALQGNVYYSFNFL